MGLAAGVNVRSFRLIELRTLNPNLVRAMNPKIVIIDYGMGNLRNVQKGFEKIGFEAKLTRNKKEIERASAIVLPGVGAFKDCMENLEKYGLIEPLLRSIEKGKPYLGICLGLQILFSESEEFGSHKGLDLIKGKVVKFKPDPEHKVPHMGWNTIEKEKEVPMLQGVESGDFFYFVHSYYVIPEEATVDLHLHHLWETFCFQHLERESFCHTIPSGEKSAERVEDIGELCKIDLIGEC